MKLRLHTYIECIYFCKVDCSRFINCLYGCFLAGVEYRTHDNNQAIKRSKILSNKVLCTCKLNQAHNLDGGKLGICIRPEVFRHHFRLYKKGDVDLWF